MRRDASVQCGLSTERALGRHWTPRHQAGAGASEGRTLVVLLAVLFLALLAFLALSARAGLAPQAMLSSQEEQSSVTALTRCGLWLRSSIKCASLLNVPETTRFNSMKAHGRGCAAPQGCVSKAGAMLEQP